MIRVAAVIEALGRGGAERLLVDTARLLDRERFQFTVYTLFPHRRDHAVSLNALGIRESCLNLRGYSDLLTGAHQLHARFKAEKPDIVHTHLYAANLAGRLAARMARCPVVSTSHDADYEPIVRLGNPGLGRVKHLALRAGDIATALVSRVQVVAVSQYVADSVHRRLRIPRTRVCVIPNGVDGSVFRPDDTLRRRMRESLGLTQDDDVLICVGRMTPQKGQAQLIRAMAELRGRGLLPRLLMVGDGALRAEYEALARALGLAEAISFLGSRWDIPDLLRAADALVLPSLHEGFGLVLAEALASAIPVVATQIGPIPEIVRSGETGLLVEPSDVPGIADAIATLLSDRARCREMGRRGREDALTRFALPLMVERLEALYDSIHHDATKDRIADAVSPKVPR